MSADGEHDPWLQAALRHAPDAQDAPPPALRNAILRAAQAAAPRPPSLRERIDTAWGWLARPPVAAAFASLALGSAIVVMWHEPPPEAVDPIARPAPVVAAAPAASKADAETEGAETAAPRSEAPPAVAAKAAAEKSEALLKQSAKRPAAPPAAPVPAPAPAAAPPPPPPPAPVPVQRQEPAAAADMSTAAAEQAPPAPLRDRAAATGRVAEAPPEARRLFQPAPSAAGLAGPVAASRSTIDPPAFATALGTRPEGWTWARPAGNPATLGAGTRALLADIAGRPGWHSVAAPSPASDDLLLQQNGRGFARLQLGPDELLLSFAGGGHWRIALDTDTLAKLREAWMR